MAIKSASLILLKPTDKLTVKLSVGLLDGFGKDSFYSIYDSGNGDYLTLNMASNIIIQYKPSGDIPYHPNQIIHINDTNIYRFNRILQDFYKIIIKPDMFTYYNNGTIKCNNTDNDKVSHMLRGNEFIEFEPSVVYDNKDHPFPGVLMRINEKSNQVDLSIDEFESLMYKFSQINITELSLQLINSRLLLEDKIIESKKDKCIGYKPKPTVGNVFEKQIEKEQVEEVVDNRIETRVINSIEDLM